MVRLFMASDGISDETCAGCIRGSIGAATESRNDRRAAATRTPNPEERPMPKAAAAKPRPRSVLITGARGDWIVDVEGESLPSFTTPGGPEERYRDPMAGWTSVAGAISTM